MRWALLLLVLAACPDRRAARVEDEVELPIVTDRRATVGVTSGTRFTLDADGTVWRENRRATLAEVTRDHDPALVEPPCTYTEPLCMRPPLATFESDGRLVGGLRGRQLGWRRIVGEVRYDGVMHAEALVSAARDGQARQLVDLVHATGGALVVEQGVALGLDFSETDRDVQSARRVVTIRLAPTTDVLAAFEATPHTLACGEYELIYPIHLSVLEGVTVQQLVDAIVTLRLAGVRMIGLGNA